MRTGVGARLVLLCGAAFCMCLAILGVLQTISLDSNRPTTIDLPRDLAVALAGTGFLGMVAFVIGYVILAELQARTAAAFGPLVRRSPSSARRAQPPTEPEVELRIGRRDSWS